MGFLEIVIVLSLVLVFGAIVSVLFSLKKVGQHSAVDPMEGLSLASQQRLRPVWKLAQDLRKLNVSVADSAIGELARDAALSADQLVHELNAILKQRDAAMKFLASHASDEIESRVKRVDDVVAEAEASLRKQVQTYAEATLLPDIDATAEQSRLALSELESIRLSLREAQQTLGNLTLQG